MSSTSSVDPTIERPNLSATDQADRRDAAVLNVVSRREVRRTSPRRLAPSPQCQPID
jgi:hypothetical protein